MRFYINAMLKTIHMSLKNLGPHSAHQAKMWMLKSFSGPCSK